MARDWPAKQIPIEQVLEISRKLRMLVDKIEDSSQAIAKTDFTAPWIKNLPSVEKAISLLSSYSSGLYAQRTLMELGDAGAPKAIEPELTERGRKIVEEARARDKPKKPRKKRPQ